MVRKGNGFHKGVQCRWLAVALAMVMRAGLGAESPGVSDVATAELQHHETDYPLAQWGVEVSARSAPFKKEPAQLSSKTTRGILRFGDRSNSMAFIWQVDAGKLFLDLNRNENLADDPAGVFQALPRNSTGFAAFPKVRLSLNTASGARQILTDLTFWSYGRPPTCNLALRSMWQGKLSLQGKDWEVGLVPNSPDQLDSLETGQLLLRAWERQGKPFSTSDGSLSSFSFSRKLFFDGHAYLVDCIVGGTSEQPALSLRFTEQFTALGEVRVTGKFIQRLVLPSGAYLVVLNQPAGTVRIPTGKYGEPYVALEHNGVQAQCNAAQSAGNSVAVTEQVAAHLAVGGPLTNSVAASRRGQDLYLTYQLVGAGGEIYQPLPQDRSKPPEFAIYKGNRKITSGKFEFG